jgi:hypothetical protein
MVCHRTKFQIINSNGSLIIAIKMKAKYRFHEATIFLFYILKNYLKKSCLFLEDLLPHAILGPYIKWR